MVATTGWIVLALASCCRVAVALCLPWFGSDDGAALVCLALRCRAAVALFFLVQIALCCKGKVSLAGLTFAQMFE